MATAAPDPDFLVRALAEFTPRRRQLGLALATAQRVRFSAIAERSVRAVVSDDRSHTCQIEWTKNGDLAARCDCRARFFCEHTAALLLAEINRRQQTRPAAADAPAAPPVDAKPAARRPAAPKPAAAAAPKPRAKPAAPAKTKAPSAAATSTTAADRASARPTPTNVAAVRRQFREEPPTLRERVAAIRGWLQQEPDEGNRRALELHLQLGHRIATATLPVVIYVVHEGAEGHAPRTAGLEPPARAVRRRRPQPAAAIARSG